MKQNNKGFALLPFIILAFFFLAGGFLLYQKFTTTPEQVIKKTFKKLSQAKTFEYKGNLQIKGLKTANKLNLGAFKNTDFSKVTIDFSGKSDVEKINMPKSSFNLNISLPAKDENQKQSFEVELLSINKTLYLMLKNTPPLATAPFLQNLKDTWIKIESTSPKPKDNTLAKPEGQEIKLSNDDLLKIRKTLENAKIIKVIKVLPSQKIEGEDTHHYLFTVDKEEVKKVYQSIYQITNKKPLPQKELQKLNELLEKVDLKEGHLWISKKTLYPKRIKIVLALKDKKQSVDLELTLTFSRFNQPLEITEPKNAKSLKDLLPFFLTPQNGQMPSIPEAPRFNLPSNNFPKVTIPVVPNVPNIPNIPNFQP